MLKSKVETELDKYDRKIWYNKQGKRIVSIINPLSHIPICGDYKVNSYLKLERAIIVSRIKEF